MPPSNRPFQCPPTRLTFSPLPRRTQIRSHVVRTGGAGDLSSLEGLPEAAREVLAASGRFRQLTSRVAHSRTSGDGTTTKLVVELQDGLRVETVIMRHDASQGLYSGGPRRGAARATACVSSQAGCQVHFLLCMIPRGRRLSGTQA